MTTRLRTAKRRPVSKALVAKLQAQAPQRARAAHKRAPAEQASHFGSQCGVLGPFVGCAAIESARGYMTGTYA